MKERFGNVYTKDIHLNNDNNIASVGQQSGIALTKGDHHGP
jgi:hypothetical protein